MDSIIIAIDGQASTGKSTQAKKIAKYFNYNYRDSGAYYRAITLYLIQKNISSDKSIPETILNKIHVEQSFEEGSLKINLNGMDRVTDSYSYSERIRSGFIRGVANGVIMDSQWTHARTLNDFAIDAYVDSYPVSESVQSGSMHGARHGF